MKEAHSPSSRFVPTKALLPAPNLTRAMLFAGAAALVGAGLWALLVVGPGLESGWLAWGIGAGVGFAAVRGGGHGNTIAVAACALTIASIASGKRFAFEWFVGQDADDYISALDSEVHAERIVDAKDWVELGPDPDAARIAAYMEAHRYAPAPPEQFAAIEGVRLARFAEQQPTLEQWRADERAEFVASASFTMYLEDTLNLYDVLFVLLGIGSAFGIVSNHTTALHVQVREAERRRRDTEAALAEQAAPQADEHPAGRTPD